MLTKLASALAITAAAVCPSASAFSTSKIVARQETHLKYQPEAPYDVTGGMPPQDVTGGMPAEEIAGMYDRGLDCASNFGLCDIDELLYLSEELDDHLGCFVEDGPEACENEIDDRQDLSEALLVQGEMREHQRYVEEGNVFPMPPVDGQMMNGGNGMPSGNGMPGGNPNPQSDMWRQGGEADDFFYGGGMGGQPRP